MSTLLLSFVIFISISVTAQNGIPAGYYDAAANLTCGPLKTALFNNVSFNTTQLSYTPGV